MELKPDENGRYRFRMNEVGNIELVSEAEKQEPEPIDHDFESVPLNPLREKPGSVLILPAKDDAELSKRLEECATKIDSAPFGLLVEFNRECTVFDIDDIGLLARGEIEAVNPTRDHLAGIRIRRDAQDDYIYIFPCVSLYPKEDAGEEWTVDSLKIAFDDEDILFDIDDEMAGHVVRIVNKHRKVKTEAPKEDADQVRTYSIKKLFQGEPGGAETELALVVAESMESAARKWAKAFSLSPEGKEKTDVVCVARSDMGAPWARFKVTNKSMNDSDIVHFNNELYSVSEHRQMSFEHCNKSPAEAPQESAVKPLPTYYPDNLS
jgi:hypothetical protein